MLNNVFKNETISLPADDAKYQYIIVPFITLAHIRDW